MQDTATIRRRLLRYERMAQRALMDLAAAYERSALAIQDNVRQNGADQEWNTYLLDLIHTELDGICDLDGASKHAATQRRKIGALLCASAEDLLATRQEQRMPAYPKTDDLVSENLYYRHASLWARQYTAHLDALRNKRNARRNQARSVVPVV